MSSWSKQRKLTYVSVFIGAAIIFVVLIYYHYIYKAPTCSDGLRNGNEQGVDCGGSCIRLCQTAFYAPVVDWTRFEEVAPGLFNVAAYLENKNIEGEAFRVPYHMILYDNQGVLITDRDGTVTLPPHRNTLAFMAAVPVMKRVPAKVLFEFKSAPDWHKASDPFSRIQIGDKNYTEDSSGSYLSVTLKNTDVHAIKNITVYVVLYDKAGNALGFSKTLLDQIPANGKAIAPFTWPINRHGSVISIEVLPVSEK